MKIPVVKLRAIKRKNTVSYAVDYMLNGKRIREIVAHDKKNAEIIKADRQHQLTLGIHGIYPVGTKIISLKDLLQNFLLSKKGTVRDSTYKRYVNYFTVFESFMYKYFTEACSNIAYIRPNYLQECFRRLSKEPTTKKKPWHPNTINTLRDLLIEIFNKAIKDRYITSNPASDTRPLDAPQVDTLQFYSKEEMELIFKNLDTKWVPTIKFLFYTGLRKGELIYLTWDKVSLDPNNPWVRIATTETHRTKSGKTETIRITSQALEILKAQVGKNKTYVFPGSKGGIMRKASPNDALKKALKKTGLHGKIHMLRHTFASHFLMDGVGNLNDLMNFMSHATVETTQIYAHLSPDYKKEIALRLEKSQQVIK